MQGIAAFYGFSAQQSIRWPGKKTIKQEYDNMIIRINSVMKDKGRGLCQCRIIGLFGTRLFPAL
jgi:hypothetical protein